ncbi:MAG: [FeFe] hydrogenase H-cluster maturation GTPase HydF [Odoribacter sp.]
MDKVHIVITGRRNTGKSSLINCILGQNKAVVSEVAGTTTDPVKKSFELPGIASIVFTDTAGIDDEGDLGLLRINKTYEAIRQADVAILVITDNIFSSYEEELIREFQNLSLPFIILHNQSDRVKLLPSLQQKLKEAYQAEIIPFSTLYTNPEILIDSLRQLIGKRDNLSLLGGLIEPGQVVMLVTPIDSEAPTGRMILPQVQMLRDILDNQCISIVLQPQEIPAFFSRTDLMPDLVVTDSQAFSKVAPLIPSSVALTSFSIVLAHHKGNFQNYLQGTRHIENLHDGNRILMLESCSHHVSCEDIGRVKIPALLKKYTGKQLEFDFIAGLDQIKRPFTDYALIIQCGGCMVTARQLRNRLMPAIHSGIPVSNYGMTIAYVLGIFERATQPFQKIKHKN